MAKITGRDRMIASVDELTGGDCSEAVFVQQRPPWAVLLFVAAFMVVNVAALAISVPPILGAALAGGAAGLAFASVTKMWILARSGTDVVLAQSSKLFAKAVALHWRLPAPVEATWSSSILTKKLTIGDQSFLVSRQFVARTNEVLN